MQARNSLANQRNSYANQESMMQTRCMHRTSYGFFMVHIMNIHKVLVLLDQPLNHFCTYSYNRPLSRRASSRRMDPTRQKSHLVFFFATTVNPAQGLRGWKKAKTLDVYDALRQQASVSCPIGRVAEKVDLVVPQNRPSDRRCSCS